MKMSRVEALEAMKQDFLRIYREDPQDGTGFDCNVLNMLDGLIKHYKALPNDNHATFVPVRINHKKLGLFWKDKTKTALLLAPPAAKLLTLIWIDRGKWEAQALNVKQIIAADTMNAAKQRALQWFQGMLGDVAVEVDKKTTG